MPCWSMMTVAHYVQSFFKEKRNSLDSFDTNVELEDHSLPWTESHGRSRSSVWFGWWTSHRMRGSWLFSNRCVCSKSDSSSTVAPPTIWNRPNPSTLSFHLLSCWFSFANRKWLPKSTDNNKDRCDQCLGIKHRQIHPSMREKSGGQCWSDCYSFISVGRTDPLR